MPNIAPPRNAQQKYLINKQRRIHCCGNLIAAGLDPWSMNLGFPIPDQHEIEAAGYTEGATPIDVGRTIHISRGANSESSSSQDAIEAAFSSLELPAGMGDSLNFATIEQYQATPDSLSGIYAESEMENYRTNERYRPESETPMQDLPRGGHAEDISFNVGDPETFLGRCKAIKGKFDKTDLHNFPWLLREVAKLGATKASNFKMAMLWKPLLANDNLADGTPFFDASRGNTAGATALTEINLAAKIAAMNTQQSGDESTGHRAKYLIVAEALGYTARKLARQIKLDDDEDLIVRTDPRIDNGMIDPLTGSTIAGNATAWHLFAGNLPAIELSMMTPQPEVTTWTKNGEDGEYCLGWSMQWTLGSVGIDPKAAARYTA